MKKAFKIFGYIILGLISIFVAFKLFSKKIFNKTNIGFNTTISNNTAKIKADNLHDAMKDYGTDETMITLTLINLTSDDFDKIYNEFGYRPYESIQGIGMDYVGIDTNLIGWLRAEISEEEYSLIRLMFPNSKTLN